MDKGSVWKGEAMLEAAIDTFSRDLGPDRLYLEGDLGCSLKGRPR
jgi:hypothetical protein